MLEYPRTGAHRLGRNLSATRATKVLEAVGLGHLAAEHLSSPGPGEPVDWGSVLSAGELQRLAVARTLLTAPSLVR